MLIIVAPVCKSLSKVTARRVGVVGSCIGGSIDATLRVAKILSPIRAFGVLGN